MNVFAKTRLLTLYGTLYCDSVSVGLQNSVTSAVKLKTLTTSCLRSLMATAATTKILKNI